MIMGLVDLRNNNISNGSNTINTKKLQSRLSY